MIFHHTSMIRIFGILAILAVGMIIIPDASAVRCSDDRNPIQLPRGNIACVFDDTLAVLLDRGWIIPAIQDVEESYADESCGEDDEYYARHALKDYPYEKVTPITHSITDGKLVKLCVQPYYKWFNIHLDTDIAGSITLEIPKGAVDLRQYDYLDCENYVTGYDSDPRYVRITGEQIAQTAESRTLKFTYAEPLSTIISFGTHAVIDGIDYSGPNFCIKEYETGGYDPAGHLPYNEPKEITKGKCFGKYGQILSTISNTSENIDLNYTITGGQVDAICGSSYTAIEDGELVTRGDSVEIYLSNVPSLEYLTIDIPWSVLTPQQTHRTDPNSYPHGGAFCDMENNITSQIIARTPEHQTFQFPIQTDTSKIFMYKTHNSAKTHDFSRIIASIMPSGMPHDDFKPIYRDEIGVWHIEPFDKRVDGRFIEFC